MSNVKLNIDFKAIQLNVNKAVDQEILTTSYRILTEAKETVPFKTTDLQKSGGVDIRPDEVAVQFTIDYAAYVEFGAVDGKKPKVSGRKMPLLYPAYKKETKGLLKRITKIIENEAAK